MSAELAISASCLSLTTHSFWFSFIDFQTQAEGCVLNFLILGQQCFVLHTSFFFFWKNFTLPKESLFPDQSEDPWFRLTGNVHGWFCCYLVGWFFTFVVSLDLEIHGYTSSEHDKSHISVYSTCDMPVEAPCLLSSNKLGKNITGYVLCSLWRTVQRFQDLSHARQHVIEQLAVWESLSWYWCPVCDICSSKCPCHCFHWGINCLDYLGVTFRTPPELLDIFKHCDILFLLNVFFHTFYPAGIVL